MKVLVTGSAGHLGEALIRTLRQHAAEVIGLDIRPSAFTTNVGSITDRSYVRACMKGVTTVLHAATLHKPHVATHTMQQFVDTNITGTLNLLQEAVAAGVQRFVFTSTTSVFGDALVPAAGAPAAWITEEVQSQPKNIYGVTKKAAEDLCQLFYRNFGLPCIVLRTSRFFPEQDDDRHMQENFQDENLKANEFLFRRVELEDAVSAHLLAAEKASSIGWGVYIISATTPFSPADLHDLRHNAPEVVLRTVPAYAAAYSHRGWKIHQSIDRVYVNEKARKDLDWKPKYDFAYVISCIKAGESLRSPLAQLTGSKGYHAERFTDGPYPIS